MAASTRFEKKTQNCLSEAPLMKITPEQVKKAIETGHDMCPEGTCIHAEAFSKNMRLVMQQADAAAEMGELRGSPALAAYYEGMHVGFRLAMILLEESTKEISNEATGS